MIHVHVFMVAWISSRGVAVGGGGGGGGGRGRIISGRAGSKNHFTMGEGTGGRALP